MSPLTRSRLQPEPRGRRIALTQRDLALFQVLDRYRYLPSNYLFAFLGGHPTYHRQRLTDLFHEGYLVKPAAQWEIFNARYRPNSYELGSRAKTALGNVTSLAAHRVGAGAPFWHEHLVCLVMASFELAARMDNVVVRDWRDILLRAPAPVPSSASPFSLSISVPELGGGKRTLRPDGLPFGLSGKRTLWFPGVEVDRHTEPLHPSDLRSRSSSILLKFILYRQFVRERMYDTHYAMPNIMVPFITVNDRHLNNMVELALSLSEGRGLKWMLFKSLPELASPTQSPEPVLDLLSTPWLRPGNPPVRLLDALNHA